jgi:DNA-binding CsgD family transcriptional regulator
MPHVQVPVTASRDPLADDDRRGLEVLSDTQGSIARLVSQGLTNQQIATRLYLSPHTVNYHLRRIFEKLGINSRVQLAGLAGSYVLRGR